MSALERVVFKITALYLFCFFHSLFLCCFIVPSLLLSENSYVHTYTYTCTDMYIIVIYIGQQDGLVLGALAL